jgi:hypothetical protein
MGPSCNRRKPGLSPASRQGGGARTCPTVPVLTRYQTPGTKRSRYPTHSTSSDTQPQDNATSRPPLHRQGHVTCGPGSRANPHPGGQPAGTAKLARRSTHVAVDSPYATTECTRTPGSPETRIRDHLAVPGRTYAPDSDRPRKEPALHGHACTAQHAPGPVRPPSSVGPGSDTCRTR